ncbi:ion transporter [Flammeovirgaceae bacterium SG7u.111]|nr:ion transporter [Flammeovirgaceae bacterium SG7u.132]WPO34856.1 ion transporter [Flammeovirgaceae bacterium SG7u.111]
MFGYSMAKAKSNNKGLVGWRLKVHEIIFEADTFWGKTFDVVLLIAILLSVLVVSLESVEEIQDKYGEVLKITEWAFTIIFTIEFIARIMSVTKPSKYVFSFFGLIDLLSIAPTYIGIFFAGAHALLVIRIFRLLRVFRIFKLVRYVGEARQLSSALKSSRAKISVFLIVVVSLSVLMGALMYLIEGRENGFTSIPRGIYWAIVTLTTVGYGDIAPQTVAGQTLAALIMIMGYGILAVPTGIVSAELVKTYKQGITTQVCQHCAKEGHDVDAEFCKFCGTKL